MASRIDNSVKEELAKSNKFLHPKSRKCIAMVKKIKKDNKKEKTKQENKLKQSLIAEKLLWFQKNMEQDICPYTINLTAALVERYMARNDEELEQIQIKRSIGENRNRQHIGREDAIRMTKEREKNNYESCGLEIPNILNSTQCTMLRKWDGNLKFLPNFKFCHFGKRHIDEQLKKNQRLTHKEIKLGINENDVIQESYENKNQSNSLQELKNNYNEVDNKNNHVITKKNEESMDVE